MLSRVYVLWFSTPLLILDCCVYGRSDTTPAAGAPSIQVKSSKIKRRMPTSLAETPATEEEEDEGVDESENEESAEDFEDHLVRRAFHVTSVELQLEDAEHRAALAAEDETHEALEEEREKSLEHRKRMEDKAVLRQFKIDEEQEKEQIRSDASKEAELIKKDEEGEQTLQKRLDKRELQAERKRSNEEDKKALEAIAQSEDAIAEARSEHGKAEVSAEGAEQQESPPSSTDLRGFGGCASGLPKSSPELDTVCGGTPNMEATEAVSPDTTEGHANASEQCKGAEGNEEGAEMKHNEEKEETGEGEEEQENEEIRAQEEQTGPREEREEYEESDVESFLEKLIRGARQRKQYRKDMESKLQSAKPTQEQRKRIYFLSFIA